MSLSPGRIGAVLPTIHSECHIRASSDRDNGASSSQLLVLWKTILTSVCVIIGRSLGNPPTPVTISLRAEYNARGPHGSLFRRRPLRSSPASPQPHVHPRRRAL